MLDVVDFIVEKGGEPEKIRESQRRRYAPVEIVDEVIGLFEDHRKANYDAFQNKTAINAKQKEIGAKRKAKEDAAALQKDKIKLEEKQKTLESYSLEKEDILNKKVNTVGNYVHESVPVSDNEDNNAVVREWAPQGSEPEKKDCRAHNEVLARINGYDPARGAKIFGHRGYFLYNFGVFFNQALVNYGIEFLYSKGYKICQTPQIMRREYMAKTAQLEQFDEELYKVEEGDQKQEKYLIATSEQPISALHAGEWLQANDLPIKYGGFSTCYRKEAGSAGKDALGLFRVHQFEKIEQFLFTKPEKSWEAFDEMIATSEEFYKSLEIPYRIIAIVSGALNNAASKKYDLEAWFPAEGQYRELVSCSNCLDYQSRALDIRYGPKEQTGGKKKYVHALNSTLCATERAMCCIIENYQTDTGIRIPNVLQKYIPGGQDFFPYPEDVSVEAPPTKIKDKSKEMHADLPSR